MANKSKLKKPINKKQKPKYLGKILLAGGIAFVFVLGGVLVVLKKEDIKSWFNKNRTYSYEEVQDILDKNDKSWNSKVTDLMNSASDWRTQIDKLSKAKAESDAKIVELETKIKTDKNLSDAQIEDLQNQLAEERNHNESLDAQISTLQSQLVEANKKISAYEQIIQQYENDATAPVSYYDGDRLIKALLVDKGSTYQLSDELLPTRDDALFQGFAVNGELVNHNEYVINTATVFNAVYNYEIITIVNGQELHYFLRQDTTLDTHITNPLPGANQEFSHWVDSDGNVVDLSTTVISGSMTLTAVFDQVYNVTFTYGGSSTTMRLVNGVLDGTEPKIQGVVDGYSQYGWRDANDNYVSELSTLKSDAVLTPNMIQMRKIIVKYGIAGGNYSKTWSTPAYAIPQLNANGEVSSYYLYHTPELTAIADNIRETYNTTSPAKPWSLVESQSGYIASFGMMDYGAETTDIVVYLQVNSVSISGNTNF